MHRRPFITAVTAALGASVCGAAPRSKTILLKSAWDTVNIGDIGHTPGTLRILEEHLPDVHVIVWAMALDDRVRGMLTRRFPKAEIVQGKIDDPQLASAFQRADLVIQNSGMSQDTSLAARCVLLGKPFGFYGQSFFPGFVEGEKGRANIALLDKAAFIYCRDSRTLAILRGAGAKPQVLEFAPDGCFGIDVRDDARALAFMKKHGLEERKFITLQLRTQTAKHPGKDNPPLNPLHPTPQQQAEDERRAAKHRELVTAWVRQTGFKVLIAPEVKKEMEHNKRLIHDPLPADIKPQVVNCEAFWNADEAASVFARAHTCICHEPHSLIIALANGTPVIHTFSEFHSPKCWMFEDIGLPEWLLEFDSTPSVRMTETLLAIHRDYPAALAKVKTAMAFVRERHAATMRGIEGLLLSS